MEFHLTNEEARLARLEWRLAALVLVEEIIELSYAYLGSWRTLERIRGKLSDINGQNADMLAFFIDTLIEEGYQYAGDYNMKIPRPEFKPGEQIEHIRLQLREMRRNGSNTELGMTRAEKYGCSDV